MLSIFEFISIIFAPFWIVTEYIIVEVEYRWIKDEDNFEDIKCRDKKQNTYMFCCCEDSWAASICEARALGTVTNNMLDYVESSDGEATPAKWTGATSLISRNLEGLGTKSHAIKVSKQNFQ